MAAMKILVAGESWMTAATHFKGWDFFSSTTFHTGIDHLRRALEGQAIEVVHMPSHEAATAFPLRLAELQAYNAIILSDIGSNTLVLHLENWLHGKTVTNRLNLYAQYVTSWG